ncbi:hypothetical protein C3L33_00885, partial [Rhododendron williamsianum]
MCCFGRVLVAVKGNVLVVVVLLRVASGTAGDGQCCRRWLKQGDGATCHDELVPEPIAEARCWGQLDCQDEKKDFPRNAIQMDEKERDLPPPNLLVLYVQFCAKDEIKAVLDVATKINRIVLLSGTPSLSRPGLLGKDKYEFARTYCSVKFFRGCQGRTYQDFSKGVRLEELNVLLKQTVMIRRLKKHVLVQLPPKRRQIISLQLKRSDVISAMSLCEVVKSNASGNEDAKVPEDATENPLEISDELDDRSSCRESLRILSWQQIGIAKLSGFLKWLSMHPIFAESDGVDNLELGISSHKMIIFAHHHKVMDGVQTNPADPDEIQQPGDSPEADRRLARVAGDRATVGEEHRRQDDGRRWSSVAGISKAGMDIPVCGLYDVHVLQEFLCDKGIGFVRINGRTPPRDRQIAVNSFQLSKEVKIAIIGITAGNVGLDFSSAQHVVFLELPQTPSHMSQAEDRAHRRGQTKAVNVYIFCAKDTLDESRWYYLNKSLQRVSSTTDGKYEAIHEIKVFI